MKLKLIAALLGLMIAIPGTVIAQVPDGQAPDAKPSPNIQAPAQAPMPGPNDQGPADQDAMDQSTGQGSNDRGSMNQGPMVPGSNDPNSSNPNPDNLNPDNPGPGAPTSNAPAPEEKNGVARISLIHGDVSTQRGDSKDWSAAALNAPVLAGDRVSTGDKARTEVQLDYANMLRLAEHTQANLVQLTRSQIQIQLGHGMANYTVLRNSDADAEIDTPNVAIRTERRESSFRILVTADDHTEVLVRKGEVEVTTPQGGTRVGQNQFITMQGAGADAQYTVGEAPARDDFAQWNTDRDAMIRNSVSRKKTSDYYVGTEDLDAHGTWTEVPAYGPVWRPTVAAGWAPYHYGRWMYVGGGWGWWPGPAYGYPHYRPIWAPAYVSFFGFGAGFGYGVGFGFGFGSIGWLPLGPGDRFHPWWGGYGGRFGYARFGEYNRGGFAPLRGGSRFSNVNRAAHDANFRGATSASGKEFGTGHMSAHAVSHAEFQNARFTTGKVPATASRESFSASGRPAAASTTRNASQNQHFFSARGATTAASNAKSAESGREVAKSGNTSSNSGLQHSSQNSAKSPEKSSAARGASRSAYAPGGS